MSTITVTPTVELGTNPPRVRLDVVDANIPEYFAANVVRHDPDGRTVPVRTPDGLPLVLTTSGATRVGLVYDYEMQYGASVTYSTLESPSTISASVIVAEARVWLIPPGVPELAQPLRVQNFGARTRRAIQTVHQPLGRREPVVHTDGRRKAPEYELTVLTQTLGEELLLDALLEDTSTLLLNVPAGSGYGIGAEYVSVGDVVEGRLSRLAAEPLRSWSLTCTVTSRPVGGTQAERTYLDVLTSFATYADVMTAYDSYLDLLAGP